MRLPPLLIGLCVLLFSACQPHASQENAQESHSSVSATATGDSTDFSNEVTPKTFDSLEVEKSSTGTITISARSGSVFMGERDSELTLTIYDDYSCFYCREFGTTDLPWLLQTHVVTKNLLIERIFVPSSPAGILMAKIALCSDQQDTFAITDAMLHRSPIATEAQLPSLATSLTMKLQSLRTCIASQEVTDVLDVAAAKATAVGVTRFPTFILASDRWIGVLTRDELKAKIQKALHK